MTTDDDAIRALSEADPATGLPFDPASARGQELLLRAKTVAPKRRRGRPRLFVVAAIGTVGLAAAAAAFVNTREPDQVLSVTCYSAAEGVQSAFVTDTEKASAVDACWKYWRAGKFSPTPTPSRLVPCVVSGAVRVFPGGPETCAKLGAPLAPEDVRAAKELVDLSDNVARSFPGWRCISPDDARVLARAALDDAGLDDWEVADRGTYDAARPCADADIDEANNRLVVHAEPRGSS